MDAAFHVAQINIARANAPTDSPDLAEFIAALEPVNALAESSPGFVDYFRRRREWFERFQAAHLALWWVPAGHAPTIDEARERLEHLETRGPTPFAFTFKRRFGPTRAESG